MTTEAQFLRERQRAFHSFLKWAAWSGAAILLTLALLAIFRT
jgi:hypothetical protein